MSSICASGRYLNVTNKLNTWRCPLVFQKDLICTWDGYQEFGGMSSQGRCRCVFATVMEFQEHLSDDMIQHLKIPNGIPLVYTFDDNMEPIRDLQPSHISAGDIGLQAKYLVSARNHHKVTSMICLLA